MKIIIATNNKHKVNEFERMLKPLGYEVVSQSEAGVNIKVEENADTFEGNAYLKAKAVYDLTKCPTIADDSGLEVYALNNAPGIYSARYGGEGLNDKQRYEKLLSEMKNIADNDRGAQFVCAISLILSDEKLYSFTGVCKGKIGYEPAGDNGFGYDPIFYVDNESFSQLSDAQKDKISHRGIALRELEKCLKELV